MAPNTTFQRTSEVMSAHIACSKPKTLCCGINLYVEMLIVGVLGGFF